jgi:hypothetical protein
VSKTAVGYHVNEGHIAERLARAKDASEVADANELMRHLKGLHDKTLDLLLQAEAAGDLRTALAAIAQARGNLELLGKLAGQLHDRPVIQLHLHPEWIQVRATIVEALSAHPAARDDVVRAIAAVSNGTG